jgi:hypothetical protein
LVETNAKYRATEDVEFVAITCVAEAARPVRAPVKVVAVTDGTLRRPLDGTNDSAVAVWISAGLPPAVLSFGVRHR